jgi:hypothetical protein
MGVFRSLRELLLGKRKDGFVPELSVLGEVISKKMAECFSVHFTDSSSDKQAYHKSSAVSAEVKSASSADEIQYWAE